MLCRLLLVMSNFSSRDLVLVTLFGKGFFSLPFVSGT